MAKPAGALFYSPAQLSPVQLFQLVAGSFILADLDIVQFDAEQGGTGERELAIPFLADMDEIVVDAAELRFVARRHERAIAGYKVSAAPESKGVVLSLDRPARLLKVVIDAPPTAVPPAVHRLVVRGAEPRPSGGFDFGPPMFADPPFALDSPLYEPVLGGLRVTNFGGRAEITFPGTAGSGWLISLASGDEATKLKPLVFTPAVHSVTVDAAASDLTLAVPGEDADEDTVLWSSPGPLFPDAGVQVAAFTPVAQKRLASALESAATPAGAVTLPIPLRFEASSAGRIAIESKTLQAHYRVHPLGSEPVQASLAGGWTPLRLEAPAGRRPSRGSLRLVARHAGRALNAGSPVPSVAPPGAGVRVDGDHWVAAPAAFLPLAGEAEGSLLPLVAVRVPLRAVDDAEAAVEVRGDAAGGPGRPLAGQVVRQAGAGRRAVGDVRTRRAAAGGLRRCAAVDLPAHDQGRAALVCGRRGRWADQRRRGADLGGGRSAAHGRRRPDRPAIPRVPAAAGPAHARAAHRRPPARVADARRARGERPARVRLRVAGARRRAARRARAHGGRRSRGDGSAALVARGRRPDGDGDGGRL